MLCLGVFGMGRHGGGSRSGGFGGISRGGSSGMGGSSGSSNSSSVKSKPFVGSYNRCYYYRGVYHSCYTNDVNYGTSKAKLAKRLRGLVLIIVFLLAFMLLYGSGIFEVGKKVNGDPGRIVIQDTIDLLTPEEEQQALDLFRKVYEKSGMPVTLYTDDMEWKGKYKSIEVYSEELYYAMGTEEDAMIVLFTYDGTFDWAFDMYCGDDTVKCLSDSAFEKLGKTFQKAMAKQDLSYALDFSFNIIMDNLAELEVNSEHMPVFVLIAFFVVGLIFYGISDYLKEKRAYEYFKKNPDKLNHEPISVQPKCPSCGANNSKLLKVCEYCGTVLEI